MLFCKEMQSDEEEDLCRPDERRLGHVAWGFEAVRTSSQLSGWDPVYLLMLRKHTWLCEWASEPHGDPGV